MLNPSPLLFTDLDGTLLDFATYESLAALPAVARLQAAGVRIIFCSSKTLAEQEPYRTEFGLKDEPFIVENGSAVILPAGCTLPLPVDYPHQDLRGYRAITLGIERHHILAALDAARNDLGLDFKGYRDLSLAEIMDLTGLDAAAAQRAADRDFSETILKGMPVGEAGEQLTQYLANRGLKIVCGGRFHTITGRRGDKGHAVRVLTEMAFRAANYHHVLTIGVGDSDNDVPMLTTVDLSFVVAKPDGSHLESEEIITLHRLPGIGPIGWTQLADRILANDLPTI